MAWRPFEESNGRSCKRPGSGYPHRQTILLMRELEIRRSRWTQRRTTLREIRRSRWTPKPRVAAQPSTLGWSTKPMLTPKALYKVAHVTFCETPSAYADVGAQHVCRTVLNRTPRSRINLSRSARFVPSTSRTPPLSESRGYYPGRGTQSNVTLGPARA